MQQATNQNDKFRMTSLKLALAWNQGRSMWTVQYTQYDFFSSFTLPHPITNCHTS